MGRHKRGERSVNTKDWPVMAKQCSTCVFKVNEDGQWANPELAKLVEGRMWSCSQICHSPKLKGKPETHLCRGTRDRHIEIFYRMGFLSAPTDAAWNAKRKELGV